MGAGLDMSAKRPPVGPNVVIEQSSGTETTVLLEGVDVADEFAAEEEQVIEVSAQGCWGQLLHVDQIGCYVGLYLRRNEPSCPAFRRGIS